jgi:hypothetical protein
MEARTELMYLLFVYFLITNSDLTNVVKREGQITPSFSEQRKNHKVENQGAKSQLQYQRMV